MRESHNLTESKEYKTWTDMKTRCSNDKHLSYLRYGGRGISVCKEWQDSFISFYKSMGKKPSAGHSIERIDTNGNYEPSNCKWAGNVEQARNKRNNVYAEINGENKLLLEWAEISGLPLSTIRSRVYRGIVGEDILVPKKIGILFEGVNGTIKYWSKKTGIKESTIAMRVKYGWSIERILTEKTQKRMK